MTSITPTTPADVAAALRDASARKHSVLIRGAGTKIDWGRPAGRVDTVLDMRGLNRVIAHQHGDLTATFEAGIPLKTANEALATHGQWLPIDPAFPDQATIGGLLATNDCGALRHRYGTPRDVVIGVQIATPDGTLAKAGGQVVKNVAGYDLGRLVTGSFGSLAAIVSATFRLSPLPAASKTLVVLGNAGVLGELVKKMMASQLEPLAFEVVDGFGAPHLTVRFASLPVVVEAQVEQASALLTRHGGVVNVVEGDAEATLWREQQARPWSGPAAAVVRASWLPANLSAVLRELRSDEPPITLSGRAAVGAGLLQIDGTVDTQARAVEKLRKSPLFGNVVMLRASEALKIAVDPWGSMGDRVALFASVKRAFDPDNILNAGRGPL